MSISREAEARLRSILIKWSAALIRAAGEHGRPNSFGVVEIATEYNLKRRDGYRLGRERLHDLWQWMGGYEKWGSSPTYAKGRFYL